MNLMHLFEFATSLYHPVGHWVSKNFVESNVQKFFMREEIFFLKLSFGANVFGQQASNFASFPDLTYPDFDLSL
jgi:hypothetical protein